MGAHHTRTRARRPTVECGRAMWLSTRACGQTSKGAPCSSSHPLHTRPARAAHCPRRGPGPVRLTSGSAGP
eukprot:3918814-Prymnesium_polylepis.1